MEFVLKKLMQSLAIAAVLTLFVTPVAHATGDHNPGGNNGFVKINNELAPDSIPNNHPHVNCKFSVEFYNFDKGDYKAKVEFRLHSPTAGDGYTLKVASGNLRPFIGSDTAGGGNDLDASEVYKLAFTGKQHEQQGYHVKLTVHAPGSKGSDKKHKVFWVSPCAATSPTHVLGSSTPIPDTMPETGSPMALSLLAGSVAGLVGYTGRLLHLRRSR